MNRPIIIQIKTQINLQRGENSYRLCPNAYESLLQMSIIWREKSVCNPLL